MLYDAISKGRVYKNQSVINYPIGAKKNYGELAIICAPSWKKSLQFINNPINRWYLNGYKRYSMQTKYRQKIGSKNVIESKLQTVKKVFNSNPISKDMTLTVGTMFDNAAERGFSMIYDISYWNEIWFQYRRTINAEKMTEGYTNFLFTRFNDPTLDNYHKTLIIPIDLWAQQGEFGITKDYLDDPISILMCGIYRFEPIIKPFKNIDIYIVDSTNGQFMRVDSTTLTKKKFGSFKMQLKKFTSFKEAQLEMTMTDSNGELNEEKIQQIEAVPNSASKNPQNNELKAAVTKKINSNVSGANPEANLSPDPITAPKDSKQLAPAAKAARAQLAKKITTRSVKPQEKATTAVDKTTDNIHSTAPSIVKHPHDDSKNEAIPENRFSVSSKEVEKKDRKKTEEPEDVELQNDNEIDENIPDDIDTQIDSEIDTMINSDETVDPDEVETQIKQKVLITKFKPDISDADQKRISEYMGTQNEIIKQSVDEMKTKIIPPANLGKVINTSNKNLAKPKAKNFYKAYNDQKMEDDIDHAVAILSKADYPLIIVDKQIEDSSDTMNLKKTYTYTLKDQAGRTHTLKFDVPIMIDDRYIYLGGNKKIIQNQMLLKPIIKSAPDEVQIVTFYNKIFIKRHGQKMDIKSQSLMKILMSDEGIKKYKVHIGNSMLRNKGQNTPLDFDVIARSMSDCQIGNVKYIFDAQKLIREVNAIRAKNGDPEIQSIHNANGMMIGYNVQTKEIVYKDGNTSVLDIIIAALPDEDKKKLQTQKFSGNKLMYATAKIFGNEIPLVFLMMYCVGLTETFRRAKVKYQIVDPGTDYDTFNQAAIKLQDKWIIWERYPYSNSLIFNGIDYTKLSDYTLAECDSKSTYVGMLSDFYRGKSLSDTAAAIDQFKDFMIDPVSAEVLRDMNMPTDFVDLLVVAALMLNSRTTQDATDMKNVRIRSNEIFAQFIYQDIVMAYIEYRKSIMKKNPSKVAVNKNLIMNHIYGQSSKKMPACQMIEDASVLNPVLELEKQGAISFRGPSGINMERAMNLQKRSYDPSMTGTIAVSTSPDANVGIQRQLTLDPGITSTRGYIKPQDEDTLADENNVNLMSPAELLSPPGALHDDAHRTSMAYKQSKYMVLVDDASPVLVGNQVEKAVPYYMSREFVVTAKSNGKIIDKQGNLYIIEYDDGSHDSFSLDPKEQKNSAGGFYIETRYQTDVNVGDTIKEGQVLAWNPNAFTKNKNDITASMNIGVLSKVAIFPNFDEYEDSAPITAKLAERLGTTIVNEESVVLKKTAFIQQIVKVGDHVEVGDPLITYDNGTNDENYADLLASLMNTFDEEILSSAIAKKGAEHGGEIVDIRFYSAVSGEELSETLRPLVEGYWKKLTKRQKTLDKYANPTDPKNYKCGELITEEAGPIETKFGKILGEQVGDGVLVRFFIRHKDLVKKGDKVTEDSCELVTLNLSNCWNLSLGY